MPAIAVDRGVTVAVRACTDGVDAATRYQAEDAVTDGTVEAKGVASNGAYVGDLNEVGRHVDFSVTATQAGDHEVVIGYANGRPGRAGLYVAESRVHDLHFPATPDWDVFRVTAPVRVRLEAGINTLRIQTDAGDDQTIDRAAVRRARWRARRRGTVERRRRWMSDRQRGGAPGWPVVAAALLLLLLRRRDPA